MQIKQCLINFISRCCCEKKWIFAKFSSHDRRVKGNFTLVHNEGLVFRMKIRRWVFLKVFFLTSFCCSQNPSIWHVTFHCFSIASIIGKKGYHTANLKKWLLFKMEVSAIGTLWTFIPLLTVDFAYFVYTHQSGILLVSIGSQIYLLFLD